VPLLAVLGNQGSNDPSKSPVCNGVLLEQRESAVGETAMIAAASWLTKRAKGRSQLTPAGMDAAPGEALSDRAY